MAWINKDEVSKIKKEIVKSAKEKGYKITVAGSNSSTLRVTIKSGPVDLKHFIDMSKIDKDLFDGIIEAEEAGVPFEKIKEPLCGHHLEFKFYWYRTLVKNGDSNNLNANSFRGAFKKYIMELEADIKSLGNWFDKSDSMTDYFHTAFYITINLVNYKFIPKKRKITLISPSKGSKKTTSLNQEKTIKEALFSATVEKFTHTKTKEILDILRLTVTLEREDFKAFCKMVKTEGIGYYSNIAKGVILSNETTPPVSKRTSLKEKAKKATQALAKRAEAVEEQPKVLKSETAETVFRDTIAEKMNTQEVFCVMTLDASSKVINTRTVHIGTVNQCLVHPREVFVDAIADRAVGIIVAHNHPSGGLTASMADIATTKRLKEASKLIGIELLDHLILSQDGFYSFSDEGEL